jgi:hypothetical protein
MHAALDCYEEMVITGITGQMPVIKQNSDCKHYVGKLLVEDDGNVVVYGYVTATNIKFLVLTQGEIDEKAMKTFFKQLHSHYIAYVMNPFCDTRGPIVSDRFDAQVKLSVARIQAVVD